MRALTFHERAALLRTLAKRLTDIKDEFYALSYRTGATKSDSWIDIDGGIGTLFAFAGKGARELPNARVFVDGDVESLSKAGTFLGQHLYVSREGAAVHINAFNFPVWGMLEKLAPTLLAGMPAIVKPATATAYLTELVARRIIESGILPEGALQLVCGSLGDLFEHLDCQDTVSFTGSADTASRLRAHPAVLRNAVPFIAETDSLNSSILARGCAAGFARVRSLHHGSGARNDGQGWAEMHRHPQGAGARAFGGRRRGCPAGGAAKDRGRGSPRRRRAHGAAGESRAAI